MSKDREPLRKDNGEPVSEEEMAAMLLATTQQRLENLNYYYTDPDHRFNLRDCDRREIFDKIQEVTGQLEAYTAQYGYLAERPITMEIGGENGLLFQRTFVPHSEKALPSPARKRARRKNPPKP